MQHITESNIQLQYNHQYLPLTKQHLVPTDWSSVDFTTAANQNHVVQHKAANLQTTVYHVICFFGIQDKLLLQFHIDLTLSVLN